MPHVISLQCANPECTARLDSEELQVSNDVVYRGAELMEELDRDARLDGWIKDKGQWQCPACVLIEGEWYARVEIRCEA